MSATFKTVQSMTKVLMLLALIFMGPALLAAQPTFEGYYKYSDGDGKHIGYSIIRNEFDPKKKEHIVKTYLRIQAGGTQVQESRVLRSSSKLDPISLEYRLITPQGSRTIDARYGKGKMQAQVSVGGGEPQSVEKVIPPGSFFTGSLLSWLMGIGSEDSKEPRGLAVGRTYEFQGIDEETGNVHPGKVHIPEETIIQGRPAYKVLFNYLKETHVSYIDKAGEVLKIEVPTSGVNAVLVGTPSEATGTFTVSNQIIEQVFGNRPTGQLNRISAQGQKKGP